MIRLVAFALVVFSSLGFALEDKERSCQMVSVEDLGWSLNLGAYTLEYADKCKSIEGEIVLSALGYGRVQKESEFAYRKLYLLLKSGEVEEVGLLIYPNLVDIDALPRVAPSITINSSAPATSILNVYKNAISKLYGCRDDSCANEYLRTFSFLGSLFNRDYRAFKDVIEAQDIGLAGFPPYVSTFDYDHLNNQVSYIITVPYSGLWYVVFEIDSDGKIKYLSRVAKSVK